MAEDVEDPPRSAPVAAPELGRSRSPTAARATQAGHERASGPRSGPLDDQGDEALMYAFAEGSAEAFEVLVRRHERGIYNFLLRSVGDRGRAEELLQDVFVRVVRSKHRYRQTAKFSTWIYKIARNLTIDESRRARFRRHASLEATRPRAGSDGQGRALIDRIEAPGVGTDEAAEAGTIRRRVAAAVADLPEDQRAVFLMRQLQGMSFKEIGEVVGAPENTVKSRMRYALEKLRAELDDLHTTTGEGQP